jgi:peptidyl-prolyl cis-trans isomerase A (cyclophilin A)
MRINHLITLALLCLIAVAPVVQAAKKRDPGLYVRFETSMGNITVRLFEKEAPITVKNFVDLAEGKKAWPDPKTGQKVTRPLYNGVTFHRVIPGFMIQGGDPRGTGSYSPGYTIPDEIVSSLKFDRPGRLAMANIGQKNSGGCQFFITEVPYPSLNNGYTIFGQVVDGQDLVQRITSVPRDANDKPRTPVVIKQVVIEREEPAAAK